MRWLVALLTAFAVPAARANSVLAARQQSAPLVPLAYSPPAFSTISSGSTVNLTYLAKSNTTVAVQVALLQFTPVAIGMNASRTYAGGQLVEGSFRIPANMTQGKYIIGVREFTNYSTLGDWGLNFALIFNGPNTAQGPYIVTVGNATSVIPPT
ncbi:MAG: hypothetical protein CYPHOPRED_000724 [Cyphobasidiales sp. Tagirdzhanova-0007]|nr:MAG: hypothetical protein CYPHOPRED_000724 [Cyphobasidiales sp. Tagirdzhanova-0007]